MNIFKKLFTWLFPEPIAIIPDNSDAFIVELNKIRASKGLKSLIKSNLLEVQATQNNALQISHARIGHFYVPKNCGQCAGYGYKSHNEALNAFLGDPPHRDILLGRYNFIGISLQYPAITVNVQP